MRGWKIYKPLLADGEEAREEGGGRDVGVRLLKRSKMTGNYISNYRREQERTPWLGRCGGKCIKSGTQSAGSGSFYSDPRASIRADFPRAGKYGRQASRSCFGNQLKTCRRIVFKSSRQLFQQQWQKKKKNTPEFNRRCTNNFSFGLKFNRGKIILENSCFFLLLKLSCNSVFKLILKDIKQEVLEALVCFVS